MQQDSLPIPAPDEMLQSDPTLSAAIATPLLVTPPASQDVDMRMRPLRLLKEYVGPHGFFDLARDRYLRPVSWERASIQHWGSRFWRFLGLMFRPLGFGVWVLGLRF